MSEIKTITIDELKESTKKGDFNVHVVEYIPFSKKLFIVDKILSNCIEEEDGIIQINYARKKFLMDFYIVSFCTNIEMPDEIDIELYDYLKENGIIKMVYNIVCDDYYELNEIINNELNQKIQMSNSIEGIIRNGLNKIVDKMPDEKAMKKIISNIPKLINKIDLNKLELVKDVVSFNLGGKPKE